MRPVLRFALGCAVLGALAAGCTSPPAPPTPAAPAGSGSAQADPAAPPHAPVPPTPADPSDPLSLAPGDTFSVALRANRTTGYDWEATVPPVLELTDGPHYVTDPEAAARGFVGAGGTMTWRFRAVQEGTGALVFVYRRPSERDTPPADSVRYDVTVTPPAEGE